MVPKRCLLYDEILDKGILSEVFNQAYITVTLKPGKDHSQCSISLINIDTKILTAVLAKRLQQMLSLVIKNDQAGFIKTWQAADNIRLA